jgi:hypothetical protein
MIVAGSAILLFSVWDVLMPREMCQDILIVSDGGDVLAVEQAPCVDPMYELAPYSNNFIPIILSICLMAFGGAILGMIIRL